LSTLFGVENDYRTDVTDEVSCIAEAQAQDVGACVYEKDFERVCEFTTRGDCNAVGSVEVAGSGLQVTDGEEEVGIETSSDKTFYDGLLCSAEELNTACARQISTTCYEGDVYWVDSCGNRENVYSDDKAKSWNRGRVIGDDEVCDANDGSDMDCGNCDYLLGILMRVLLCCFILIMLLRRLRGEMGRRFIFWRVRFMGMCCSLPQEVLCFRRDM